MRNDKKNVIFAQFDAVGKNLERTAIKWFDYKWGWIHCDQSLNDYIENTQRNLEWKHIFASSAESTHFIGLEKIILSWKKCSIETRLL